MKQSKLAFALSSLGNSPAFICLSLIISLTLDCTSQTPENTTTLALVIGNSNYSNISPLQNARNDAELIHETFSAIGVDSVIFRSDLSRSQLNQTFKQFFAAMSNFDVGIVYYAGHGMQNNIGENYIIPTDYGSSGGSVDLFDDAFQLERLTRFCSQTPEKAFVFMIDACRNNPYTTAFRATGGGLAPPRVPAQGVLISYSTASGKVAGDYPGSQNGLYAKALSDNLLRVNLKVEDVLKNVGSSVRKASSFGQSPEWWGNLEGDIFLNYSPKQFRIQIWNEQERIIQDWIALNDSVNLRKLAHVSGMAEVSSQIAGENVQMLSGFIELNNAAGQTQSAQEASLFLLDYESWITWADDIRFQTSSTYGAANHQYLELFDTDAQLLFEKQQRFCHFKGLGSPEELQLFIWHSLMKTRPNHSRKIDVYKNIASYTESSNSLEIRMASTYRLVNHAARQGDFGFATNFPIQIEDDTIANIATNLQGTPYERLMIGDSVVTIKHQQNYLDQWPSFASNSVTVEVLRGSEKISCVLPPHSGFLTSSGVFIPFTNAVDQLRDEYSKADEIYKLQQAERNYLTQSGELPTAAKLFSDHSFYVSLDNQQIWTDEILFGYQTELSDETLSLFQLEVLEIALNGCEIWLTDDFSNWTLEIYWLNRLAKALEAFRNCGGKGDDNFTKRKKAKILSATSVMLDRVITNLQKTGNDPFFRVYSNHEEVPNLIPLQMIWSLGATIELHRVHYDVSLPDDFVPEFEPLLAQVDLSSIHALKSDEYLSHFLNFSNLRYYRLPGLNERVTHVKSALHTLLYDFRIFSFDEIPENIPEAYLFQSIDHFSQKVSEIDLDAFIDIVTYYSQFMTNHFPAYRRHIYKMMWAIDNLTEQRVILSPNQKAAISMILESSVLVWSNHFINYSPFHAMGTGQEFDKAEDFGELNELKDFHQKLVKSIRNFYSLDSDESLPAELFWLNTVQSKLDQIDAEWQSIQQK